MNKQLKFSVFASTMLTTATMLLSGCGGGGDSSPSVPSTQQINLADGMGYYESSLKISLANNQLLSIGNSTKPNGVVNTLDGSRFSMENDEFDSSEIWFSFYLDDHSEEKPHKLDFLIDRSNHSILYGTYFDGAKSYVCDSSSSDDAINCNKRISVAINTDSLNPLILNFKDITFYDISGSIQLNGELKGFTTAKPIFIGNTNLPKASITLNNQNTLINNITWNKSSDKFELNNRSSDGQKISFEINNNTLLAEAFYINNRGDGRSEQISKIKTDKKDGTLYVNFTDLQNPNGGGTVTGSIEYQLPRSTLRNEKGNLDLNAKTAYASHSTFNTVLIKKFFSGPDFGEVDVSILNKKVVAVAYSYPDEKGFYQTVACAPDETPCRDVTINNDLTTVTFNNTKIGTFNFNGELFSEFF